MTAEQILADAASLSVSERLRVVQAIWDSLPENVLPTPNTEIKSEFDRRLENYRQNPDSGMTLDELRRRLDADSQIVIVGVLFNGRSTSNQKGPG